MLKEQPGSSAPPEQLLAAPHLANAHRFRGGHYGHLAEAIVHMKIADQESRDDKGKERHRERGADTVSRKTSVSPHNVASTSRQTPERTVASFVASNLAELAGWYEKTHTFTAEPAHAYGHDVNVPRSVVDKLLNDAKTYMQSRLQPYGLKLDDVLTGQSSRRLEINLNHIEMRDYVKHAGLWASTHQHQAKLKMLSQANAYLDHFIAQAKPALDPLSALKSKNSIGVMRELLQNAPGLVIGEAHNSKSSKRVVIDNIKALKSAGVTTLFLEHVCADSHGKALAEYIAASKGSPMPARLKVYLDTLTQGNLQLGEKMHEQGFAGLVKAAKDGGLNIIPLDTAQTYATSDILDNTRIKVMNHYAAEKIRLTQPEGKWIAFVGSEHATTYRGIPGLAQLQGVRSLIVDDFGSQSRPEIQINVKNYASQLNPDVTMSYKV